ncbi:uncharacterized protein METZ01_LOCUS83067 [marine metagenome]|uniref:Uncharacterized protein n=1 Tax=marine metagenome TaxID=408172 RepID=A0A381UTM2_9ZZZZ
MDILGHIVLVAADVEVCPFIEPFPHFGSRLLEAVLDVDFLVLVA